jgi:hypothetical protein
MEWLDSFERFTWSRLRRLVVWARTERAVQGQAVIPMTKAVVRKFRELILTDMRTRITKEGITINILVIVESILSVMPPE